LIIHFPRDVQIIIFLFFSGTFFIVYDFFKVFNKDRPSNISKETFFSLINTTFKDSPETKRQNITLMVSINLVEILS
jgi:hypothetical protein